MIRTNKASLHPKEIYETHEKGRKNMMYSREQKEVLK